MSNPAKAKLPAAVGFIKDLVIIVAIALVVSFLLKTFLVRTFWIPSQSMEQTLRVGDRILVNQLAPATMPLKRGDIVVFRDPGGWLYPDSKPQTTTVAAKILQFVGLAADTSNDYLVKRVIGLPGDRVSCCDAEGKITVNGVPVNEPYLQLPAGEKRASGIDFAVTVPKDALWVMGDNRYSSKDSRYNQDQPGKGFLPVADVVGRAFLITWPFDHFTLLKNPQAVFSEVPEPK